MTPDRDAGGRSAFLGLALVILGGLLFAAGVMVGRQMRPAGADPESPDQLQRIDQRDRGPKTGLDGGTLSFPEELAKPVKSVVSPPDPRQDPVDAGVAAAEDPPASQARDEQPGPAYYLQLASYREQSQARQLVEKLVAAGTLRARMVEGEVAGKGIYYRVRIGPFRSRTDAEAARQRLEPEHRRNALIVQGD